MTESTNRTYLLVGTVTKDLLPDGGFTTGGTVTYASTMAKSLGWQPVIITRAAPEFEPPAHLAEVDWHILPALHTTTYRNVYYPEGRVQTIGPIAEGIQADDIPLDYRQAEIVHLCPLAQDVDPAVGKIFENSLLTATPQGWLRQWDERGIVSLGGWQKMDKILPHMQVAVFSIEDVENDWDIIQSWIKLIPVLIVTEGEQGCTVFFEGQSQSVPPRPATPTDLTGAGDVFAAAFFIRLQETKDVLASARFANVAASMAIEREGVAGVPTRSEIEAYLAEHP